MSKYFRGCLKRKGKVDIIHSTVIYQTYHCTALFSLITLYYSQQTSWLIITFVSLIKRPTHVDGTFARQIKKFWSPQQFHKSEIVQFLAGSLFSAFRYHPGIF